MPQWPFKHIKQKSSWPMQPFVLSLAVAIMKNADRKASAAKAIERCVRAGARLAVEFGMPADIFVEVAKTQIIREGGIEAQVAISESFGAKVLEAMDEGEKAVADVNEQLSSIFSNSSKFEA